MSDNAFHTIEPTLKSLLEAARDGTLQLPEFQRSWVWDDARIRSLIASVSRAFPVGAIMTLKTGGDLKLKARPVEGVDATKEADTLLLDGQQRITSLFQTTLRGEVVETKNSKNQGIKRWYYIDMRKALDDPSEREDAIVGVPEDRMVRINIGRDVALDLSTQDREFENLMFPLTRIFDPNPWARNYRKYWGDKDEARIEFYDSFEEAVLDAFKTYKLPVIELASSTSREAVCAVFEKVNTGGKPLDAFELVTASFAVDGFDLRQDWRARQNAFRDASGSIGDLLGNVSSTDFLQVIALLDGLERRNAGDTDGRLSASRASLLRMEAQTYQTHADAAQQCLIAAAKFLRQLGCFFARDLPYQTQLVPLAVIIHALGKDWERETIRAKVAHWYWCGVFGELYGAAVESRFVNDVTQVPTWVFTPEVEPVTVSEATFNSNRLQSLRTRGSAAYKGINALLLRRGARDWRSGQPYRDSVIYEEKVDIHHVFPVKWCVAHDIKPEIYNSILNKTPLSASANRRIGGAAPSEYLQKIASEEWVEDNIDDHLESHLIDPDTLRSDDFEAYLERRQAALLRAIESAMGKRVFEGVDPEPIEEGEDTGELVDAAE